jgi:hypothetical protein
MLGHMGRLIIYLFLARRCGTDGKEQPGYGDVLFLDRGANFIVWILMMVGAEDDIGIRRPAQALSPNCYYTN